MAFLHGDLLLVGRDARITLTFVCTACLIKLCVLSVWWAAHGTTAGVALHAVEYLLYKHSITGNIKVLTTQYQR
jgi:hypothetical protein